MDDSFITEYENSVVLYDNAVNISLQGLKRNELDIFMACAYKLKDKGCEKLEIGYSELMNTANFWHMTTEEFHDYLKNSKIGGVFLRIVDDKSGTFEGAVLFKRFSGNLQKKRLTLCVNDEFINIFSELKRNFTALDLAIYTSLKSKYSKLLYQNLCQYRQKNGKGFWSIPLENDFSEKQPIGFKTIFGVPEKYANKEIPKEIINPAIKELAPYMKITCETILKGRKTIGYKFDFEENRQKALPKPKVRELTDKEKEEYDELVADSEQMELFTSLSSKIKAITDLDDLSVKMIVDTAESQNKGDDEVVSICQYAIQQNTNNLAAYIITLIAKGFSVPKKTVKKNNFNNFEGRKYDYDELEKQLLANNGIG